MLIKVAKHNIRTKKRSALKGAFVIKVLRLVGKLTAPKESLKGYYCRGDRINFVDSLILCYYREVYSSTKGRFEDI
jgi:hypothetical protein